MRRNVLLKESRESEIREYLSYRAPEFQGTGQIIPFPLTKSKENTYLDVSHPNSLPMDKHEVGLFSTKHQLEILKSNFGFNVSLLAGMLRVKRPTIYEWLDGKEPRPSNQNRLNIIFSLFEDFENLKVRTFLYKKLGGEKSLYDLLTEKDIDLCVLREYLMKIQSRLSLNQETTTKRQFLLKQADFKSMDKEQKYKKLEKMVPKI
ncbi:MAG: hypothetical protein HKM04_00440 [Legionellales bacterium]|nr:hypothetical protein [Legionellales bacterium]